MLNEPSGRKKFPEQALLAAYDSVSEAQVVVPFVLMEGALLFDVHFVLGMVLGFCVLDSACHLLLPLLTRAAGWPLAGLWRLAGAIFVLLLFLQYCYIFRNGEWYILAREQISGCCWQLGGVLVA